MASQRQKAAEHQDVNLNMTPMIDCTFQLIIFFVISTQAASDAYANVKLCRPYESVALESDVIHMPNGMIVNVVSMDPDQKDPDKSVGERAARYEIMKDKYEIGDIDGLIQRIKDDFNVAKSRGAVDENPKEPSREFFIEIRADKRVHYEDVAPVIKAGVLAGVRRMQLSALMKY